MKENQMYDTTFAKANNDYRREQLRRSWVNHRSLLAAVRRTTKK